MASARAPAGLALLLLAGLGALPAHLPDAAATHTETCEPPTGGEILLPLGPQCVTVASGERVAWTNANGVRHDPGDLQDGGDCFRAVLDRPEQRPLSPGERYTVELTWDGGTTLEVATLDTLGSLLAHRVCQVQDVADPDRSTPDQLVIPWIDYRHPHTVSGTIQLTLA